MIMVSMVEIDRTLNPREVKKLGCITMHTCGDIDTCLCVCLSVRLSVCVCVGHTDMLCKNGWFHRDAVWGWLKKPCIRWGQDSHGKRQFWGIVQPTENAFVLGVSATVYAAKGILQFSIVAWHRDCCSRLQCSWMFGVTLHRSPWKISLLQCGFLSK